MDQLVFDQLLLLPPKRKWYLRYRQLIAGAVAILLLVGIAVAIWQFVAYLNSRNIMPLLADDTDFLVAFNDDQFSDDQMSLVAFVVADIVGGNREEIAERLERLSQMNGEQFGLIIRDHQPYWFVRNPRAQDLLEMIPVNSDNINQASSQFYFHSSQNYRDNTYHYWGERKWIQNTPGLEDARKTLENLGNKASIVIYWPQESLRPVAPPALFGMAIFKSDQARFDFGFDHKTMGEGLQTKSVPDVPGYLEVLEWGDQVNQNWPDLLRGVSESESNLVRELFPAELLIERGDISAFINDPYQQEIAWQVKSNKERDQAAAFIEEVLKDLSGIYPVVEERILEDKTTIDELIKDITPFMEDGHENELSEGIITYPDGQILYKYDGKQLNLKKDWTNEASPVDNPCILPESIAIGRLNNPETNNALWISLNFSYGYSNLVYCFTQNQ